MVFGSTLIWYHTHRADNNFYKFQLEVLNRLLMTSNQHFFGGPQLPYQSIPKYKIFPAYSSLCFSSPKQRSLLHLNTESSLSSPFLMLHINKSISLLLRSKNSSSCLRGPNILMNKGSPLWHNCYVFDHMCFKVASPTFLPVSFLRLKESACETRKNIF